MKLYQSIFYITVLCSIAHTSFSQIAVIDYSKIFLLHPKMANYHFGMNTFYNKKTSMEMRMKIGRTLQSKNQEFLLEYKKKLKQFHLKYFHKKRNLVSLSKLAKRESNKNYYFSLQKQIQNIKDQYLQKKLDLQQSIQNKRSKLIQNYFVSSKERNQIFFSISKEIGQKVDFLQKKHNFENVFQGADKLKLPLSTVDYSKLPLKELPFFTIDNFFIAFISDSKTIGNLISQHQQYEGVTEDKFINQTEKEALNDYLKSHLLTSPFPPFVGSSINISYEIAESLFQDYNVPTLKLHTAYAQE
ncbi:hypothetical protein MJH12_18895 [bacterium]|nr:hypothetical protein [bacterium]